MVITIDLGEVASKMLLLAYELYSNVSTCGFAPGNLLVMD